MAKAFQISKRLFIFLGLLNLFLIGVLVYLSFFNFNRKATDIYDKSYNRLDNKSVGIDLKPENIFFYNNTGYPIDFNKESFIKFLTYINFEKKEFFLWGRPASQPIFPEQIKIYLVDEPILDVKVTHLFEVVSGPENKLLFHFYSQADYDKKILSFKIFISPLYYSYIQRDPNIFTLDFLWFFYQQTIHPRQRNSDINEFREKIKRFEDSVFLLKQVGRSFLKIFSFLKDVLPFGEVYASVCIEETIHCKYLLRYEYKCKKGDQTLDAPCSPSQLGGQCMDELGNVGTCTRDPVCTDGETYNCGSAFDCLALPCPDGDTLDCMGTVPECRYKPTNTPIPSASTNTPTPSPTPCVGCGVTPTPPPTQPPKKDCNAAGGSCEPSPPNSSCVADTSYSCDNGKTCYFCGGECPNTRPQPTAVFNPDNVTDINDPDIYDIQFIVNEKPAVGSTRTFILIGPDENSLNLADGCYNSWNCKSSPQQDVGAHRLFMEPWSFKGGTVCFKAVSVVNKNGNELIPCNGQSYPVCTTWYPPAPPYTIQGKKVTSYSDPYFQNLYSGQTITVQGVGDSTNNPYFFHNLTGNKTVSASVPLGSIVGYTLCYNDTGCHNADPIWSNTVTIEENKAQSENYDSGDPYHYADLWWHYKPLTPNCKDVTVIGDLVVGNQVTIQATYESGNAQVDGVGIVVNPAGTCSFSTLNQSKSAGPGISEFYWTPQSPGTYDIFCRAWNDGVAECRGDCVDGPPRYPCEGPAAKITIDVVTPTPTPTPTAGPFIRAKNVSFNEKTDYSGSSLTAFKDYIHPNAKKFQVYNNGSWSDDVEDERKDYVFIVSGDDNSLQGIVSLIGTPLTSFVSLNQGISESKRYIKEYESSYADSLGSFDKFYEYITAFKDYDQVSSFAEVQNSQKEIVAINSNLTWSASQGNLGTTFDKLIIVNGNLTFGEDSFKNPPDMFNVKNGSDEIDKNLIVVARKIVIKPSIHKLYGVFIADEIEVSNSNTGTPYGLKIKGNIVAFNKFVLTRRLGNNLSPIMFIVRDIKPYLYHFGNLSIIRREQR